VTLRAFLLGLLAVTCYCRFDAYTSLVKTYGWWNSVGSFPSGPVFLLVFFTLALNLLIKLVRRAWALKRAELMLIWCMSIVAATVSSEGLTNYWLPSLAGPAYFAGRADVLWKETALDAAPQSLLVSKDPRSVVVRHFYEGQREGGRFPWKEWLVPIGCWRFLIVFFYLAAFFLCGILRKQWVDVERLQFPVARVPLEFTEEDEGRLFPRIFYNRAFLVGVTLALTYRLLRALPLLFGHGESWVIVVPFEDILLGTPLEQMELANIIVEPMPIGFAYLVPSDVSLSIWLFHLLGHLEVLAVYRSGSQLAIDGEESILWQHQQAGAYLAFTVGVLFVARRHLASVLRKAVSVGRRIDDTAEPVSYRVGFWGLLLSSLAIVGWFTFYGMRLWVAVALLVLMLVVLLVQARVVSQSGMYFPVAVFGTPRLLHNLGFGVFGRVGAVLAQMQSQVLMPNTACAPSPAAIHSFRISEVFDKYRKLLLPAMIVAVLVAMAASGYTVLDEAYSQGALNFSWQWPTSGAVRMHYQIAHQRIEQPTRVDEGVWAPFAVTGLVMAALMFLRARFYWWPVHPIGLLTVANWQVNEMLWLPFLLGWMIKVFLVKFTSGRTARLARFFFVGVIVTEAFVNVLSSLISTFTDGRVPLF
jgi:hypothetical protein